MHSSPKICISVISYIFFGIHNPFEKREEDDDVELFLLLSKKVLSFTAIILNSRFEFEFEFEPSESFSSSQWSVQAPFSLGSFRATLIASHSTRSHPHKVLRTISAEAIMGFKIAERSPSKVSLKTPARFK